MKFTPSQVIAMARESGFPPFAVENISESDAASLFTFATLAADRAIEAAAHAAETNGVEGISSNDDEIVAAWLRAMKEHQ